MPTELPESPAPPAGAIRVTGASEHNLKHVDAVIPRGVLAVVTGVSGSGKSSLAFDTLCVEGRRRYLETFSSYARQFLGRLSRPDVVSIEGLSPAVAVDQATTVRSPRSTVGTLTELYDLLRLLWARLGTVRAGAALAVPVTRQLFSFNSPDGACLSCKGLGVEDRIDPGLLVADPERTVRGGALKLSTPNGYLVYSQVTIDVLDQVCRAHGFSVDVPWKELTDEERAVVLGGSDRIRIPFGKHPLESRLRWTGITARPREEGVYKGILPVMEQILRQKRSPGVLRYVRSMPCRACDGTRLSPAALSVIVGGQTIAWAAALEVEALAAWVGTLGFAPEAAAAGEAIRSQLLGRCALLVRLGLGYLTLDRESTTLSGGEAQRLRLARQAGLGLRGVLHVLDEPTVGLHPHDAGALLDVLEELRDQGNTVVVVEHDEETIRRADWIVDVGPGAGEEGGRVLYCGPADGFLAAAGESPTRAFLSGRERAAVPAARRAGTGRLDVSGVTRHNLHGVSARFLLGAFNVVSGVSGAGKSTLVAELRRLVEGGAGPGRVDASRRVDKVLAIDQAPIGRTPRSNPATYTGLFDRVRALFAAEPEAVARGLGAGSFSFNVPGGRCEACEGAGVTQVGMHFLGSVAVPCESCGGRRFGEAALSVRHRGLTVHDVLSLPIARAAELFADEEPIARPLAAMVRLGLGYLALGHPATALSGGEAQRVKLAAELARPPARHTLTLLDEPTAGLHAADVRRLLDAAGALVAAGHTVIAVEHDLDVLLAADRVVDLGPGHGARGGRVVVSGTPEEVAACPDSLTGAALRALLEPGSRQAPARRVVAKQRTSPGEPVRFGGVTTHNLKGVDVEIPAGRMTVVTGVSGSGKSSLAFDTVFAEGQQRFAESFPAYARRFLPLAGGAEFETASGLSPAVAVRQEAPSRNPRSTVASMTEVHDLYRLLFARAGTRGCPRCDRPVPGAACPACGAAVPEVLVASMFSPASETGACPACHGLGLVRACDPDVLVTHPERSLAGGALAGHATGRSLGDPDGQQMATLAAAAGELGLDLSVPWRELADRAREVALAGTGERTYEVAWSYRRGARRGVHRFTAPWPGLLELVRRDYGRKHAGRRGEALEPLMTERPCAACRGGRLRPELLAVRFAGTAIHELLALTVEASLAFLDEVASGRREVPDRLLRVTADLRADVRGRLERLRDAGLAYLALDRPASTLSGGEAQRVRLAAQLRSGLTGVTYVLDEPTAGLHPRDTARLVGVLHALRDAGNTVVVVEHEPAVVAAADHLIEVGPGAGPDGGRIVAAGTPAEPGAARPAARRARPRRPLAPGVAIRGASLHNLASLDVDVPAGGLVAVTGVSGSGKSSLVSGVIAPSVERAAPAGCRSATIHAPFRGVVRVDGGRAVSSPWSTVATLSGVSDGLRDLFAASEGARSRGLKRAAFSTAARGGRCEACEGLGQTRVAMDFLPDVWVTCAACGGRRFREEVLACTVEGRSLSDLLEMTAAGAQSFVASAVRRGSASPAGAALAALSEIGLGYLRLGQPARTLSGGERQRVGLAAALLDPSASPSLFVFDEPSRGLHPRDVAQLLVVFDRLVAAGHTLLAVEHDLDVIDHADWVVDLGPEGGAGGGRLVAEGPPEAIAACAASHTGRALGEAGAG